MISVFKRWFSRSKEQDVDDSQNPWAGLASYEDPETAERKLKFCGRDDDSYDLSRLIMGNIFVTLYGKSGIGKTSLLNAGVFPELREEQYTPVSIRLGIRDEEHPQSYQTIIVEAVERVVARTETIKVIDEQLDQQSIDYLWNYFVRHRFYDKYDEKTTPVIVLDQFEEVFRRHRYEAELLLRQLDYLNDKDHIIESSEVDGLSYRYEQNFRFVVSIREDDLYRLEDSIDNCYLPALKRCRYRLHSLSEQGARDVIFIPGIGLFDSDEKESIAEAIISKSSNADGSISTNIISLLCSRIYVDFKMSGTDYVSSALVENFIKDNPFERFYNEATRGFSNKEKSYIEDNFVDSTSRRNSIPESDFLMNVKNGAQLLKGKNRILQHVSTSTAGNNNRVELIHDSFCEPLFNLKKIHEEQRINVTSLTLLSLVTIFIIWFISSVFQDSYTIGNLLSESSISGDLSLPIINTKRLFVFGVSLVNLLIIPILIYASVKRLTITSWLSVYGIISNSLLMFLFIVGQNTELPLRWSFATMVLLVPVISLFYSINEHLFGIPQKQEILEIIKSTPLICFCLFVSLYLFYLCVFNRALGLAEPRDSFWGVVVIPLLTHEIIRRSFVCKTNVIAYVVLCCQCGLLAYNTYSVPFALPSYVVICVTVASLGVILWSFWNMTWRKRIIAVMLDFLIMCIVVILNIGFNLNKIKYDSVSHVYNWVDVMVHNQDNHIGIVSANSGESILPCAFDSLDIRQHYCFINSSKIPYDMDVTDYKGLFSYKKDSNNAQWKCLFIDEVECNILKYKNTTPGSLRDDSIRVYAAKVYHEVRNANVKYFTSGEMYSLRNVSSIDTLVGLQNEELSDILNEMSNSSSTTQNRSISFSLVLAFNKAFARSFYLCMLKDRILQKDSVNLFNLPQEIVSLYFYDAGKFELTTNSYTNFNMGNIKKTYFSTFRVSDLRNNTIDSWYNYVNMLLGMDMGSNAKTFSDDKADRYWDILTNLDSLYSKLNQNDRNLQEVSDLLQKGDKMEIDDFIKVLNLYKNQMDFTNDFREQINTHIDKIDIEKRLIDSDFQKLINNVFVALSHIVLNSQNIYNSEFVDICEQLYIISVLRQYEISPIYLQLLGEMYNTKNPIYQEFRNLQEQEESLKQKVRSFHF